MKIVADLHIHSKYSRATSTALDLANLEKWARIKGLSLLGTGDFTHPKWITELKSNLTEKDGILFTKTGFPFILQTEISLMYSQEGRGRKVHLVVLAPNFEVVGQITEHLKKYGRIDYDGRPIFGIPCPDFAESMHSISEQIEIIPAHAWTPWFGVFGSKSGFDSIKEAFGSAEKYIHAIETGMSSDPEMNWRLSALDKYQILSSSDAHSFWPWRIGREATIFDTEISYKAILNAIRTGQGIAGTVETWPEYGKYHYDGHRLCNVCFSPQESLKYNNICPRCRRPLTIGVEARVEELADRERGYRPKNRPDFKKLVPLSEIIAATIGAASPSSKKVFELFNKLIQNKSEFEILLDLPKTELIKIVPEKIADNIIRNREAKIKVQPGYDGVYGYVVLDEKAVEIQTQQNDNNENYASPQKSLMDY